MPDTRSEIGSQPTDALGEDRLWERVRQSYLAETPTRDPQLTHEIDCIRAAMQAFSEQPWDRYVVVEFLGVGGAGIVFKVWDRHLLTLRALKLARPIEGKEDLVAGLLSEEISRLQEVSHPNVISIFDAGQLESTGGGLPFYTMTFLRGALPAQKFFAEPRSVDSLLHFLHGLFSGVAHLHNSELLHLDLKPSNVFVAATGYAVVADLGGARRVPGDQGEDLMITCTSTYAHPALLALTAVTSGGDDNRRRGKVRREQLRVAWDLFAMGRTVIELVRTFDAASPGELSAYQRKYVLLQGARLLDGETSQSDRPLGLTRPTLVQLRYHTAPAATADLEKLLGRRNPLNAIPELSVENASVIQVTRARTTRLTPRLATLLGEPLLRRLASISQLGLVRLVYPDATHDRLAHSLGAYSNAAEYITALYNDAVNPLFRQIVSENDLVATLLAALLHDLGQYQHAHDLDDVERTVFRHETLTAALLKGTWHDFAPLTESLRRRLEDDWGVQPERVLAILEANPSSLGGNIVDRILHSIVSGPLDVDKLDYLVRDSAHCGTVYGQGLDRSRLLSTLTVVYETQGEQHNQYFALGIHEKGRAAAEAVGFIRFQMFRAVYWHHAVRAAKAMLQRAAYEWLAPDGRDPRQHDRLKRELYQFILQSSPGDAAAQRGQSQLFNSAPDSLRGRIGYRVRPQWSGLNYSDALALEWLHERTTDVGKQLIDALARRQLYKRAFIISSDQALWTRILDDVSNHERLKERSEELRKRLKAKIDQSIQKAQAKGTLFHLTGIGEHDDEVKSAARVLGGAGTVLLDLPRKRGTETLRFYPEVLHRGQREEFMGRPLLAVSPVWSVVAERLHETAGSIRVFVHPDIDILRIARESREADGPTLLGTEVIQEVLNTIF
jgi:serine/threonine protein kinase